MPGSNALFPRRHLLAVTLALTAAVASASPTRHAARPVAPVVTLTPEQQLLAAIDTLRAGDGPGGYRQLRALAEQQPNFRLAQLLYAELLAVRSGGKPLVPGEAEGDARQRFAELLEEARLRLAPPVLPEGGQPSAFLRLAPAYRYAIAVDAAHGRFYLLENTASGLHVVLQHYAGIGRNGAGKVNAGDLRTPLGIYRAGGFLRDGALPELYGSGAFPLSYPNAWDLRRGRSGSGIWLHGVPRDTYARAPRSSEGCITMANDDLLRLRPYLSRGIVPVAVVDGLDWLSAADMARARQPLESRIGRWAQAAASSDPAAYLDFYADDFRTDGMDKVAFERRTRQLRASLGAAPVQITDLNLYRYPGERELIRADFVETRRTALGRLQARKQQYWRKGPDGEYRIELEASD